MDLTNVELISFDIQQLGYKDMPRSAQEAHEAWKRIDKLPASVVRQMEREEAARQRKKKIREERAEGKRKKPGARGRRHWKSKEATRKRMEAKLWKERPFDCVIGMNTYKCKSMDRQLWDSWAAPLWQQYAAKDLYVRFPRTAGTKACPWSMFNIKILHKEKGILLDGESLLLYTLSTPTA